MALRSAEIQNGSAPRGAKSEAIAEAESRIGTSLPPSFRRFLEASNGFVPFDPRQIELWPVEKIDLFQRLSPEWFGILQEGGSFPVPTNELKRLIQISPEDDAMVVLLCPARIADGEFAVLRLGPHTTDWSRSFGSFWEDFTDMARRFYGL